MTNVTFDHIQLRSPDPEATAIWFERHLGAEFVRSSGRLQARRINVFIATVVDGDGVGKPPVAPYQGLDHFGLKVEDIDAVAASARALLSRPNPPQSVPGFEFASFAVRRGYHRTARARPETHLTALQGRRPLLRRTMINRYCI